jgi:alpha-ketoglutarate-dependent taurine dioxygenase
VSAQALVRTRNLFSDGLLPLIAEPAVAGVDIVSWAANNRERLEKDLLANGAILFRGFGVDSPEKFERLIAGLWGPLLAYTFGSTPRSHVSGNVYTSTEYPAHQEIPLHNEMSYSRDWPLKIWFLSLQVAPQGGETPLGDSRRIFQRIDPRIRDRFAEKKILYVRNYGEGLDVPWQKVFETSDPARVGEICRAAGIECEWRGGDRLRTRELCQAVARHPRTGEMVWFNQAHLFHISSLPPEGRDALLSTFAEEDLPRNAYYGDGSPLEEEALGVIREALRAETVAFPWEPGDVLLVDNMLTAHGRRPFAGARRVVVGMTDSYSQRSPAEAT